jgi:hypothetical protein
MYGGSKRNFEQPPCGDSFDRDAQVCPFKLRRGSAAGREEGQTRQESFKHDRKYRCLLQPRGARGDVRISCRIKSGQHLCCGVVASSGCLL